MEWVTGHPCGCAWQRARRQLRAQWVHRAQWVPRAQWVQRVQWLRLPTPTRTGSPTQYEQQIHTDPNVADTDHDGLSDSFEATLGTDPLNPDSDMRRPDRFLRGAFRQ